ncbi:MAG: hypothetical protein ACE5DK_10380 [Paracoccaceae bacterium]
MTRLALTLCVALVALAACGIDGDPLTPPAKSTRATASVPV